MKFFTELDQAMDFTKKLMSISSQHLGLTSPKTLVMHSLEEEHQQWLNDPQAQSEYQQWIKKELQRKEKLPDPLESRESNLIFGE